MSASPSPTPRPTPTGWRRWSSADGTGLDWADSRAEYHRTADARRTPAQQRRLDDLGHRSRNAEEEIEWRVLHALSDFADPAAAWDLALEDARAPFAVNVDCNRTLNAETDAVGPTAEREQCTRVTMPVLVVHGAADPRPIAGVQRLADALPDARLVVLPGCGHQPWREDPHQVRALLQMFITDHEPPAASAVPGVGTGERTQALTRQPDHSSSTTCGCAAHRNGDANPAVMTAWTATSSRRRFVGSRRRQRWRR